VDRRPLRSGSAWFWTASSEGAFAEG
jgi:hypothetical protein